LDGISRQMMLKTAILVAIYGFAYIVIESVLREPRKMDKRECGMGLFSIFSDFDCNICKTHRFQDDLVSGC
jgi:hypothetical protein